ncbi:hypothetical protein [Kitasatospora sp. NPDC057541]|uniref:hypothetical protein n=1 Tax=unclassified Kitasatospora TaxID=2633591 RepID=UPI0036A08E5F
MGFDQARANRIFLPGTYAGGVPYELFRELRARSPVCWVEEPPVGEWPAGPGYWAVLRHADVKHVLRTPELFSSHLGATQIRDPDTAADLAFARTMMLNQDPPDHARLRRIVAAAFTPRALRELTAAIGARAAELVAAVRPLGEIDFVPLAADLPVWTLAPDHGRAGAGPAAAGRLVEPGDRLPGRRPGPLQHRRSVRRAARRHRGGAMVASPSVTGCHRGC